MNDFNVNEFVVSFSNHYENRIIDRITISNLLLLDCYDLVSIVLRKKCNIFLQFDEHNTKAYIDSIYYRVEQSNSILRDMGNLNYILVSKSQSSLEIDDCKEQEMPTYSDDFTENVNLLIQKVEILKESIKMTCEDLPKTHIKTDEYALFFNKDITSSCTNCAACVNFCPTDALLYNEDKTAIFFKTGRCIGCNLCEQVCEDKAIINNKEIDLIEFAFDRTLKKIDFRKN